MGARPVLPTPDGEPARRAREMFSAYLAETRAYRERDAAPEFTPMPEPTLPPVVEEQVLPTPSPRRYDLALALLGASPTSSGEETTIYAPPPAVPEPVQSTVAVDEVPEARPPVGVPAVRPSAPVRPAPEAIDQSLLETLADNALLHQNPDGTAAFEVSFHDEVFQDLACTIQFGEDGVVATFRAVDVNTRRLLEAESGRLRVRLEDRGLKVKEVRVAGAE
ncbi:MAG: hypothetical protein AAFY60_08170 [Myxococcota bacterium]